MCGIAGIYYLNERRPDAEACIASMTDALTHRGPDAGGYHFDSRVALGHRRLSIIDLTTGQQPLYNEDHSVSVVFNGEIYNFMETRSRLQALGHVFRTKSDIETIAHAYEKWGERSAGSPRHPRPSDRGADPENHVDGRETNDTLIWSLVVFQTWFDLYVDGIPRRAQQAVPVA